MRMKAAIDGYLTIARGGAPVADTPLQALATSLDAVLFAFGKLGEGEAADDEEEPPVNLAQTWEAALRKSFPDLGWYPWADPLGDEHSAPLMADAIDDAADIAADLAEALWRWERYGEADATWYLSLMFPHWGRHLLNLRSYLHARTWESG